MFVDPHTVLQFADPQGLSQGDPHSAQHYDYGEGEEGPGSRGQGKEQGLWHGLWRVLVVHQVPYVNQRKAARVRGSGRQTMLWISQSFGSVSCGTCSTSRSTMQLDFYLSFVQNVGANKACGASFNLPLQRCLPCFQ